MFGRAFKKSTRLKVKKKNPYPNHKYVKDLGRGGFAIVKLYKRRGNYIAIKSFDKSAEDSKFEFDLEIKGFQGAGTHRNVVKVLDAFEDEVSYNVVLEYCEQGVLGRIYKAFKFDESHVRDVIVQCCEGLKHLLGRKVIHRDIKPDNILVKQWNPIIVVLADLNFSKKIKNLENKTTLQTVLGTDGYMAPEIENLDLRKNGENYNFSIDVFALGIVGYELFTEKQRPSFDLPAELRSEAFKAAVGTKMTAQQIMQKAKENFFKDMVANGVPLRPEEKWEKVSDEAKDIISKMVLPIYSERPTYETILSSAWATKEYTPEELVPILD